MLTFFSLPIFCIRKECRNSAEIRGNLQTNFCNDAFRNDPTSHLPTLGNIPLAFPDMLALPGPLLKLIWKSRFERIFARTQQVAFLCFDYYRKSPSTPGPCRQGWRTKMLIPCPRFSLGGITFFLFLMLLWLLLLLLLLWMLRIVSTWVCWCVCLCVSVCSSWWLLFVFWVSSVNVCLLGFLYHWFVCVSCGIIMLSFSQHFSLSYLCLLFFTLPCFVCFGPQFRNWVVRPTHPI